MSNRECDALSLLFLQEIKLINKYAKIKFNNKKSISGFCPNQIEIRH